MTKNEAAALTAEQETSYQQMADWAEKDMPIAPNSSTVRRGSEAAAHGRDMLVAAGMDPAELKRLIGGRPSLDPEAELGKHSPQLNLRVSADLKQEIKDLADARNIKPSVLARELLTAGVHELRRAKQNTHGREKHSA